MGLHAKSGVMVYRSMRNGKEEGEGAYNDVHWSLNEKKEIPREAVVSMKHPVQVYVYALK